MSVRLRLAGGLAALAALSPGAALAQVSAVTGSLATLGMILGATLGATVLTGIFAVAATRYHRRRREERHGVDLIVTLSEGGDIGAVPMVDLSRRGARLLTKIEFVPGARIRLTWQGHVMKARVIWSGENFTGIRFQRALPRSLFGQMLEVGERARRRAPEELGLAARTAAPGTRSGGRLAAE